MATRYTAQEFIDAIQGNRPDPETGSKPAGTHFISTIARRVGCTRKTVYAAIDRWSTVADALAEEKEKTLDFTEGMLLRNIREGREASIFYYLNNQGRDRGYNHPDRVEITGRDGKDLLPVDRIVAAARAALEAQRRRADGDTTAEEDPTP